MFKFRVTSTNSRLGTSKVNHFDTLKAALDCVGCAMRGAFSESSTAHIDYVFVPNV